MDEHAPDYEVVATDYARSRTLAPTPLEAWHRALAPHFERAGAAVLDVGAGTGQFARSIATWFGADVVALEPAAGMRAAGVAAASGAGVRFVAGRGEAIPLADRSVDRAWLSAVVHHFVDADLAFRELRRVVRDGGFVLLRGFYRDLPLAWHFRHFPGIERAVAAFPSTVEVIEALARSGLSVVEQRDVAEVHVVADDWETRLAAQRVSDTMLRPLSDEDFAAGMAALRDTHHGVEPLEVTLRLLVCEVSGTGRP